jgi:hypothetical protein
MKVWTVYRPEWRLKGIVMDVDQKTSPEIIDNEAGFEKGDKDGNKNKVLKTRKI